MCVVTRSTYTFPLVSYQTPHAGRNRSRMRSRGWNSHSTSATPTRRSSVSAGPVYRPSTRGPTSGGRRPARRPTEGTVSRPKTSPLSLTSSITTKKTLTTGPPKSTRSSTPSRRISVGASFSSPRKGRRTNLARLCPSEGPLGPSGGRHLETPRPTGPRGVPSGVPTLRTTTLQGTTRI